MELFHHHFENLTSTSDWAKAYLKTADRNLLYLVTADAQTHGRGQFGRNWVSPPNQNIYGSFIFFISENQEHPLALTHILALSIIHTLEDRGLICRLKWPNDVLVNQKKISGILCETEHFTHTFGVVIGFGINLNMPQHDLDLIDQPATSLLAETATPCDRKIFLEDLKIYFQKDLELFLNKGFHPFSKKFQEVLAPFFTTGVKKLSSQP